MTAESLDLVARFEKEKMTIDTSVLEASSLQAGTTVEEGAVTVPVSTQSGLKALAAKGLPSGLKLKFDKTTGVGVLTGKAKKAGTFTVTLKATAKSGAMETVTVLLVVQEKQTVTISVPSTLTGDYWGFVMSYADVKSGDNGDYLGTVFVTLSASEGISASVVTPKGTYEFAKSGFDSRATVSDVVYDCNEGNLMRIDDAYNVRLTDSVGNVLNLSFDPDLMSTSAEPFGGSFQAKGGTKFYVNGEQRVTSWTDDSSAARRLADYIGTYHIKATKVNSDEWSLTGVASESDLELVVDETGLAHLTGSLDGQKLDAYSYVYDGGLDYLWLDFAFVHKSKPIYFELHLAPVADHALYDGCCYYTMFR